MIPGITLTLYTAYRAISLLKSQETFAFQSKIGLGLLGGVGAVLAVGGML